ncbi:hypothetical protein NDA13_001733 [Ustilago tritici]|nr:hypothetical protein NDA13_001733 [Ustilago tritici]
MGGTSRVQTLAVLEASGWALQPTRPKDPPVDHLARERQATAKSSEGEGLSINGPSDEPEHARSLTVWVAGQALLQTTSLFD